MAYREESPPIVPESSVIRVVSFAESEEAFLTIDGQVGEPLFKGDQIVCRTSPYAIHLVRPPRMLYCKNPTTEPSTNNS